ncbi:potassium/proton antiporter [Blastopirellula marina]|uniref:Potassium/proton antiporter n=1 Tax=Blastopirellula marina TaxID=124 RepID=A0A2S8FLX1_9BACT|nr:MULTISPECIES: potassium/proton antiporter [Pirellulaceae]PQO33188.1 potassium/proton antiporter [Blastopirellula marina]RCS52277.1 potassium/proton antiporter [Bremerella cremea]
MFWIEEAMLVAGTLLLLGVITSKISARYGVPMLVLFLGLGMLAGSEGFGGIEFEDYELAHAVGSLALAIILFDGGLGTTFASISTAWKPSLVLATLGVLITSLATGLAACWILGLPLLNGLLLGSIVGSTDAAAVFSVLRTGGFALPAKLSSTLEIESGSNDPMAIFLTVGLIELLTHEVGWGGSLILLFVKQMVLGGMIGIAFGYIAVWITNRLNLNTAGLYPLLTTGMALLTFGLAAHFGGSGFLAVYLAGIVIGNNRVVFKKGTLLFHNALAWLAQIAMFIVLGLLCFPSELLAVKWQALGIAVVLIFVARPIAVVVCMLPFRFRWNEMALASWGGLKGAVPITLATFPLLFHLDEAQLIFDVVFFVVVVSALVQGWSLPWVARKLNLDEPIQGSPPVQLEIHSLRHVDGDILDYTIEPGSLADGRKVSELGLPEGVTIALIARNDAFIPPRGATTISPGDHVIVVVKSGAGEGLDAIFCQAAPLDN